MVHAIMICRDLWSFTQTVYTLLAINCLIRDWVIIHVLIIQLCNFQCCIDRVLLRWCSRNRTVANYKKEKRFTKTTKFSVKDYSTRKVSFCDITLQAADKFCTEKQISVLVFLLNS